MQEVAVEIKTEINNANLAHQGKDRRTARAYVNGKLIDSLQLAEINKTSDKVWNKKIEEFKALAKERYLNG